MYMVSYEYLKSILHPMKIVSRALNFNRSLKEMQVCVLTKRSRIILPIREHLHI